MLYHTATRNAFCKEWKEMNGDEGENVRIIILMCDTEGFIINLLIQPVPCLDSSTPIRRIVFYEERKLLVPLAPQARVTQRTL